MFPLKILIGVFLVHAALASAKSEILTCKNGEKIIFTDDKNKCKSKISKVELKTSKDKRVNYRYPQRQYVNKSSVYSIFIEVPEVKEDTKQLEAAVKRLSLTLDYIFTQIPKASHEYLKAIEFYIMIGPRSNLGGESNGLRYFPKSGDTKLLIGDKRWTHSVVIYNVDNFMWLTDLWVKKSIMHELSHAWHYKDWSNNYPMLKKAWLSSRQKGLYLSQKDIKGKLLKPAYASRNEKEYFSELSAIYFVGGNYYPYNKKELKNYDMAGYSMVKRVWGF